MWCSRVWWLYSDVQEEPADIVGAYFCYFHLKGGGSAFLRSVGTYLPDSLTWRPRSQSFTNTLVKTYSIKIIKLIHLLAFDGLCRTSSLDVVRATGVGWGADNNLARNKQQKNFVIYCHEVRSKRLTLFSKNRNKCALFANVNRATRIVISLRKRPSCVYIYIYIYHLFKNSLLAVRSWHCNLSCLFTYGLFQDALVVYVL
jgi:hypothetical protein